jgi:hypothetical protein
MVVTTALVPTSLVSMRGLSVLQEWKKLNNNRMKVNLDVLYWTKQRGYQ